jgi:hypothetical protein
MRPALFLVPVMAASAVFLAGCGYAGEPKPPSLRRPAKVTDLAAVERGAKIVVTFTLPQETTEGLPITGAPDVEMRIGVVPVPWNQEAWQASSDRIPVPAWQAAPAASGGGSRKATKGVAKTAPGIGAAGASGASGARVSQASRKKAAKATASAAVVLTKAFFSRTIQIDAAKYTGKPAVIGVRVLGPTGRDDGWSTVSLEVFPVLPVPRNVLAADAPGAVHLQWSADAPAFRIFRKQPTETDWVRVGDSTQTSFDDKSFDYGKAWQYYVQSVRQVGENWLESDPSDAITFTPADRFAPAVPAGLEAISGTRTIELVWDPVTDADLAGYRVYRNGVKIADAVLMPSFSDKDVVAGAKYSYQVSAVDLAGNESGKCAAFEITME